MITNITLQDLVTDLDVAEKLMLLSQYIPEQIPSRFNDDADINSLLDKFINKYPDSVKMLINNLLDSIGEI